MASVISPQNVLLGIANTYPAGNLFTKSDKTTSTILSNCINDNYKLLITNY